MNPYIKAAQRKGFRIKANGNGEGAANWAIQESHSRGTTEPIASYTNQYIKDTLEQLSNCRSLIAPFLPGGYVAGFVDFLQQAVDFSYVIAYEKKNEVMLDLGLPDEDFEDAKKLNKAARDLLGHLRNYTNAAEWWKSNFAEANKLLM